MASRKLLVPRTAVYQDGRGSEPMIDVGSVFPADALNIFLIPCLITARNAQSMPQAAVWQLLLCAPRPATRRRAAEQSDELAPPDHSITSSARASSVGGTSRPSPLAVFRLMASSYLVGACTGR